MTKEIRLGLSNVFAQSKPPVLHYDPQHGRWRLWTTYNPTLMLGTYIDLYPDGKMHRVTIKPDYTSSVTDMEVGRNA